MRARLCTIAKAKKGQILTLALLVMFVGAIILGGLFMYMDSSLSLTIKSEESAVNYYAADSGVEDAIAWLQHEPWLYPEEALAGWPECDPLDPEDQPCFNSYSIGNRSIDVSVVNPVDEGFGDNTFLITSTATDNESAKSITIESYVGVETLDLYKFSADAITSNCDCPPCDDGEGSSVRILGSKGEVQGNVSYVCSIDCKPASKPCAVNGTINPPYTEGIPWWPDMEEFLFYFRYMATDADIFTDEILYVENNVGIGPLYRDGELEITNKGAYVYPFLAGIIYVDGDLKLGKEGGDFTLNLSNQNIFAEGTIDVGGKVTITGSGSIIARGNIEFSPNMESGENDFVFIMSVEGEVGLQPGGEFWGSVAAAGQVRVSPDNIIGHRDPNQGGFVFPGIEPIFDIITYNITKFE